MTNAQTKEWNNSGLTVPAHVPNELVRDFDFYAAKERIGGEEFDVHKEYRRMQEEYPEVFYTPRNGGHWVVTRFKDMEAIYTDPEQFPSYNNMIPPSPQEGLGLVNYDGARHTAFRALLQPFFSPKVALQFESTIANLSNSLIDEFIDTGECEFIEQFAQKLPTLLVMKYILNLPEEDVPYLMPFVNDVAKSGLDMEAFGRAFFKIREYIAEKVIPARRANPGKDVISALIHGKAEGGRPVTEEEILAVTCVLIIGGLDTVVGALGFVAMHLAKHPEHRRQIGADPAMVRVAADELLRRYAITNHGRTVAKDFLFKGVKFAAGDMILIPTTAAAVDETQYENALEVDFQRKGSRKNLTFGFGSHYCIGNFVARAEIAIFISEWLKRIPEFEVKPGTPIKMLTGITNSIATLPLQWKK